MARKWSYNIGGISVRSEFQFTSLAPSAGPIPTTPDVEIRFVETLERPSPALYEARWLAAAHGDVLFNPVDGLSIRILKGREIHILRDTDVSDSELNLYLIGTSWGTICHQRGLLPLHCSAIGRAGECISFSGPSGAGKSTLAASLSRVGYEHVCDDMAVIDFDDANALVRAMPKGVKLWNDAIERIGLPRVTKVATEDGRDKFYADFPAARHAGPLRFAAHCILKYGDSGEVRIEPITGAAKFQEFYSSIYRSEWINWLRPTELLFKQVNLLANSVSIYRLSRPRDLDRLSDVAVQVAAYFEE